jgi:hypothetical protein
MRISLLPFYIRHNGNSEREREGIILPFLPQPLCKSSQPPLCIIIAVIRLHKATIFIAKNDKIAKLWKIQKHTHVKLARISFLIKNSIKILPPIIIIIFGCYEIYPFMQSLFWI